MYQPLRLFGAACLICLAGCGEELARETSAAAGGEIAELPASSQDAPTIGHIGQVEYGFDPERLTRAEIQLALPPRYETSVWATKLIPVARAEALGGQTCRYGQSGRAETCTAEKEEGLALALLERPLAHYRQSFVDEGIPAAELQNATLAGTEGFEFTAQAEGAGVEYAFHPVEGRTLLVARRFLTGAENVAPEIREVLRNLEIPS